MLKAIKNLDISLDELSEMPEELVGEQLVQFRRKNKTKNNSPVLINPINLPKIENALANTTKDPLVKPLPSIRNQSSPLLSQPCVYQTTEPYQRPIDVPSCFPETYRNTTESLFPNASPFNESPFLQRFFFNQSPATPDNFLFSPQNTTPFSSYRPPYGFGSYNLMPFKGSSN